MVMPRRTAWLFASFVAIACGGDPGDNEKGPNRPPVIENVEASAEVVASDGRFVTPIRVAFRDDDGDVVNKVRIRIPDGNNYDDTTAIQDASAINKSATLTLEFDAATVIRGRYEYFVTVFDSNGLESAPASRFITFK